MKSFTLYPDFALSKDEKEGLSKWRLQCLQEERITSLKTELAKGQPVSTLTRSFISLPSEEALSGHPTGQPAIYGQKLHPLVAQKLQEMVATGIVDTAEVWQKVTLIDATYNCTDTQTHIDAHTRMDARPHTCTDAHTHTHTHTHNEQ